MTTDPVQTPSLGRSRARAGMTRGLDAGGAGMGEDVVLDLTLVRVVKNLGAPWMVTSDANGDDLLLVDDRALMSAPLVNLIIRLVQQRRALWQFRHALEPWNITIVPQARGENGVSGPDTGPVTRRETTHRAEIWHEPKEFMVE